ncbi:CRISPR-associated endonuclease Cas1 [Limnohabitans sp.]|jgi:CRISPR-associated protein Cas1|uniref:CRISPR-associated endonuclease Cas1 n=1 Tax=Limnohabitans sp. TaxID=1907725 RepID=UPI0037BF421B
MSTLYIDRQGSQLHVQTGVLHITTPNGEADRRLPLKYLDRIVLRTDTQLSSKVLCALADSGVNLIALGGRGGQKIAQITGTPHNDARRRWQQVLTLSQPEACAQLAHGIIHSKVKRQRAALAHIAQQRPDIRKPLFDGQQRLGRILETLRSKPDTHTLDQLRGFEGAAAALYFEAYFSAFAPALGATGRNRRPPRDPVNAVLSLSYTMLYAQATAACWAAGLDPALGALHTLSHGRAALACDLMEPYRPLIDLWVWQQFRQGTLRAEHFGHDGAGACLLSKAGRGHFYPAWEQQAQHHQRSLLRYARAMDKALMHSSPQAAWSHLMDTPVDPTNDTTNDPTNAPTNDSTNHTATD